MRKKTTARDVKNKKTRILKADIEKNIEEIQNLDIEIKRKLKSLT